MITLPLPQICKTAAFGAVALVLSCGSVRAQTTVSLGDSMSAPDNTNYAIFTLGSATTDSSSISGGSTITGDIGLAGSGNLNFSGAATIKGNVYDHTGGTFKPTGGATETNGAKFQSSTTDAPLNQGVIDAMNASATASGLTPNGTGPSSYDTTSGSLSLTATNGKYVMNLTDLVLSNTTLTLNGPSTAYFVFNISGNFSLSKSSILLSGGLTASNVLFNYTGTSSAGITLGTSSVLNGIILAASTGNYNTSAVTLTGSSKLNGEIIADKVTISGTSQVTAIVSP